MKTVFPIFTILLVANICGHRAVTADAVREPSSIPAQDSPEMAWWRESMEDHDARMQWWREARFGMFVHWGVYSGLGGTWQGQTGQRLRRAHPAHPEDSRSRFIASRWRASSTPPSSTPTTGSARPRRPAWAISSSPPSIMTASPCMTRRSAITTSSRPRRSSATR